MPVSLGDDIRRGDWIACTHPGAGGASSERHGPVGDVYPYRCSAPHLLPGLVGPHRCDRTTCLRSAWQVVRFHDGTEVTLSSTWPDATLTRPAAPAAAHSQP